MIFSNGLRFVESILNPIIGLFLFLMLLNPLICYDDRELDEKLVNNKQNVHSYYDSSAD